MAHSVALWNQFSFPINNKGTMKFSKDEGERNGRRERNLWGKRDNSTSSCMDHGKREAGVLSLRSKVVIIYPQVGETAVRRRSRIQFPLGQKHQTCSLTGHAWELGNASQVTLNFHLPGNSAASSMPARENYTWVLHFHALIFILRKVGLRVLLVILKWNK